jgi:hypothetical protein
LPRLLVIHLTPKRPKLTQPNMKGTGMSTQIGPTWWSDCQRGFLGVVVQVDVVTNIDSSKESMEGQMLNH